MMRIFGTILAGLLGLAFGSFLNVCLSRWPAGESVVKPRSHCRACGRTLSWWENVPVVSWLALRGRCRTCGVGISPRYVVVEAAVGTLWAVEVWRTMGDSFEHFILPVHPYFSIAIVALKLAFLWILVALAALDADHLWLPDWLTLPGIALGFLYGILLYASSLHFFIVSHGPLYAVGAWIASILAAAVLILLIRWVYWLVRRKEGIGLGDAKLMALLAAWLGLPGALVAFFVGVVIGALVALGMLLVPRRDGEAWAAAKLPLGTFLCIGGIVSSLLGQKLIEVYLRWAGF